MWQVEYYTKNGGRQPARDWLEGLEKWAKAAVKAKVEKLRQYGLELLNTEMLKPLEGDDADFYEIRAGKHRMATYFDRRRGTFVLLHGFRKQKPRERQEVEEARRLLREYLSREGG